MTLSILIATTGRSSLLVMLESLKNQLSKDDWVYIVSDGPWFHQKVNNILSNFTGYSCNLEVIYESENLGYYGHGVRNKYQTRLKGDYILHADDDDIYGDNSIESVKKSIREKGGKMLLFKIYDPHKNKYYWETPVLALNNIGTPCGAIPNIPQKMGRWGLRYGGDFDFYNTCKFEYEFIDQLIYLVKPEPDYDKNR